MTILDMEIPKKKLFEDPGFPASSTSLFSSYSTPITKLRGKITWLRPQEISRSPQLFPENPQDGQIKQGLLGDCWFLCACEALRKNRQLLDKLRDTEIDEDKVMISFDITALFTSIDIPLAGETLATLLEVPGAPILNIRKDSLLKLLDLCLTIGDSWKTLDPAIATALQSAAEDGEFWVEEHEFFRDFDEVTVGYPINMEGHILSLLTGKSLRHTLQLSGQWVLGLSAGGCRNNSSFCTNPKFWLRILDPGEVVITILQKKHDSSNRNDKACWSEKATMHCQNIEEDPTTDVLQQKRHRAIGLHVWKVEKKRFNLQKTVAKTPTISTECHTYDREVKLHCDLTPGYYLVIPSTFMKDEDGHFLLRAFSTSKISLSVVKAAHPLTQLEENSEGEWEIMQFTDSWINGKNAGGSRNFPTYSTNPHLPFSILSETGIGNVRITLCQESVDGQFLPIGFHVYQVHDKNLNQASPQHLEPVVACVPHRYTQEMTQLCTLPTGNYEIVPSTYLPNSEAQFTVTVETKIDRKPFQSQENLGQTINEVSYTSVMQR
ncbi:calpain-10 [Rhincodon typus]|uniref:calpain-10 n=1 Tax=Rhincodon typus TaxID=259920 RepID=UPI002030BEDC|nr:calpain-10 [Rhincodon typus]